MRELWSIKVKELAEGHIASQKQRQDSKMIQTLQTLLISNDLNQFYLRLD